jgi:hypothetical protein
MISKAYTITVNAVPRSAFTELKNNKTNVLSVT